MVKNEVKNQTIKELSNALGISKVSLYKLVKRAEIAPHTFKNGRVTYITEFGVALIRAHYSKEQADTFNDIFNEGLQVKNDDMIGFLQEQLKEKDEQIKSLLRVLENEQRLKAMPMLAVKAEKKEENGNVSGFFSRFFGQKKG